ncbi:hypothetical protein CDAR_93961 [Caerostris darwini]|uniref:Uncharacterized protein n=1 Tax=Caerostris darwini TaxID=1538125 RepID=A0AAV4NJV1_9ARAC|nr:hypothetical protein CDAR_93961 [Caerostris darwini]
MFLPSLWPSSMFDSWPGDNQRMVAIMCTKDADSLPGGIFRCEPWSSFSHEPVTVLKRFDSQRWRAMTENEQGLRKQLSKRIVWLRNFSQSIKDSR